ncbi:MAG: DUF1499 domain-containing protein [Nitrospirales bacterium]|nr:DUF1499 domain-containing protein [Nitrospira sp.]MDR4499956.1 DUF1499 domain-containing protein [Nitrospirales bacterium]
MPQRHSLKPCPDSPNCVSSHSHDPRHHIEPLAFSGTIDEAKEKLRTILERQFQAHITTDHDFYLHGEVTSPWFRFIDDIEFLFDAERHLIHVRSASRTGYWDLGVNRKRIERLRKQFADS